MDNVRNRCLFSIPAKVEMAEEQEYLRWNLNAIYIFQSQVGAIPAFSR